MKPWSLLSAVPGFGGLVQREITCNSVIQSCWQRKLFIKRDLVCECVQFILPVIVIRATLSANFPITRFIVSSQKENAVGMQKQSEAYPLISALRSMMVFVWATTWIIGHWQTVVRWLWGSWMYMSGRERRDDNWDMMDGSVSSGPAQHLWWAEFQGRVGVAEDQKFKVLRWPLKETNDINIESPSLLWFIKAWWQICSSGDQFVSLYELSFFITALRWRMVSRGLI